MNSPISPAAMRRPGRPRSPESHQAIIDATFSLLEERGFLKLTIEAIAYRARVSKATIYRRWPNKSALILDLLLDTVDNIDRKCADPSPRAELRNRLLALVEIANSAYGRNFTEIIAASHGDPELGEQFVERFLAPRQEKLSGLVKRGVELGELPPNFTPEMTLDLLYGPIFYRMMVSRQPVTAQYVEQLINATMGACG